LLVKFQLDYVLDFAEPSDAIECLNALPTDMESAYKLVLDRIETKRRPTVVKILSWLFHARRLLLQDEMREAIAVRLGRENLPKPLVSRDALIIYCQGLVTVDEGTDIVRFSHFTVKEFLSAHYRHQLHPRVNVAQICLTYLNFTVFEKGPCTTEEEYISRCHDFRFSEYAAKFWGEYVQGECENEEGVLGSLSRLFRSPPKMAAIQQIRNKVEGKSWRLSSLSRWDWTPLHVIADNGFSSLYSQVIVDPKGFEDVDFRCLNARDQFGATPLMVAARKGYHAIAARMIENGGHLCKGQVWRNSLG